MVKTKAENLAKGIVGLGLPSPVSDQGRDLKTIGIFSKNTRNWSITDLACACANVTSVTLYDTLGAESTEYIIDQSELSTIFVQADKIKELSKIKSAGKVPSLKSLVVLDTATVEQMKEGEDAGFSMYVFETVMTSGQTTYSDVALDSPTPDSVFTICYTSGTTGNPKGVMLSHANFMCIQGGLKKFGLDIYETDRYLSYLPLAHILERLVSIVFLMSGTAIGYFGGDILKLKDDLGELAPTIFVSVPRLFNRFYDAMTGKVKGLTGISSVLANKGIKAKLEKLESSGDPTHAVYDKLVFNKFKAAVGGKVRFMLTGSAPISKDVLNFLKIALCAPIYEGYGQTETCAASCITFSEDGEAGHVGGVMPYAEAKLVDIPEMDYLSTDTVDGVSYPRGEICFRGSNNFLGYFKLPDKTAEALDEEGWVHTGDIGTILPNGAIKIIDRKKNIFKLAQGEYIAPDKLENAFHEIDLIK